MQGVFFGRWVHTIGVTVSKTEVHPPEGGDDTYTIVLDTQPTADVEVTVTRASGGDGDLTRSPPKITFTTADWSTPQTVTIAAAEDDDGLEGTATFTHSASSSGDSTYNNIDIASVAATEADNDIIGVTVSKTSVHPPEGGDDTYTIVLGTEPTANVTVTVSKASGGDASLTRSPPTIVFTTANWSTPQTVTIAAAEDNDGLEGTATFTHSASSSGDSTYNNIAIASVAATEADNDTIGVTVSETAVTPPEGGVATYTIVLDTQPTADVEVTVDKVSGGDDDLTRSPASITFTTGNWSTARTVTITAAEDADGLEGTATFTHSASSSGDSTYDGITIGSVVATENENDTIGVTVSKTEVHPPEGDVETYTIVLDTQPTADVEVTVDKVSGGDGDLTRSPPKITFTTADWSTPQTVTIAAAEDDDGLEGTATFTHSASSSGDSTYNNIDIASVAATEAENDTIGVTVSKTAVTPPEGGSDTYTIVLDTQPTASVTVTVSTSGGDPDLTADRTTITFTPANWSTAQTVTISAAEDDDGLEGTATFTHGATSGDSIYNNIAIASVAASEVENDTIGVTVSKTAVTPLEGGSDTYTIVLGTEPTADVEVTVSTSGGDPDLTADRTTITFTPANWSTAQTVTISAAEDDDGLEGTATFTHSASSSGDSTYAGIDIASVVATENENDTIEVKVSKTAVTPPEGDVETYTIVLGTKPTANVTVTVSKASGGDGDLTRSPSSIMFTTANWASPQTVTIAAAEDDDGLEGTATFDHSASSGDSTYNNIAIGSVVATENENDTIGVTVSETAVTAPEGGVATYTIVLDTQPTADVTVAVAKALGGDPDLTHSPNSITFTAANWSTARTVTITADEDDDGLDGTATFIHSVSNTADTSYDNIDIASVDATEDDNDLLTVTVEADHPQSVNEGDVATFTVKVNGGVITQDLTVNYRVTGTATAGDDYTTPSPTSLTIPRLTPSETLSIQTKLDTVLDDGETLIVTLSDQLSNGVDPVTIGARDSATTTIVDSGEVTLSVSDETVNEGDPAIFKVTMSGQVSSVVEVNWTTEDRTATEFNDYVASPVRLTFNPGDRTQSVTVQTLRDTVAEGDETFLVKLENLTGPSGVRLAADHEGTGTILDNVLEAAAARHDRVNQEVMPQVAQAMTASTLSAITGRFDVAVRSAPSAPTTNLLDPSDIDRFVRTNEQALKNGTLTSEQLLSRSSFLLPLSGEEDGEGSVSVWGSGDFQALSSSEEGSTDWKGNVTSFHLGADALLQPELLAGFSISRSIGSFEFTDRTDPVAGSGTYKSRMTTVHPYVNWSMREGLGFWATVGYGQGEVEIKEVAATRTSDTKLTAAAAGFNVDLLTKDDLFLLEGGTTKLKFKGEDAFARVEVEGRNLMDPETRINPLTSDVHRSRLSLEASHERRLESGSIVTSSLEIGLRYDGGEGATGAGAEIGGVLSYRDPTSGLTLEGRARALVVHQDDHKEWGIGGLVRLDPDADGTGLSLTVIPAFGKVNSTIGQLYEQGAVGLAANDNAPAGNLDVEIGYGFGTLGDRGLLTPFGGWSLSGEDEQRYRIGGRLRVGPAINLSIEGERNEAANDAPAKHSIMLRGEVWF